MRELLAEYIRIDDRGRLIQVSTYDWKQCNVLEIKKGKFFGGHYHKNRTELFYVISGVVKFRINNRKNNSNDTVIISICGCLRIDPYDLHEIEAIEDAVLVELLSEPYNEKDVYNE